MSGRSRRDPKQTEREILVAAQEVLQERPFRDMTVDAVMRRTDLSRPTFYVYFRDRHDVALRIFEEVAGEQAAIIDRWARSDNLPGDMHEVVEGLAAIYAQHGSVLSALAEAARSDRTVEIAYHAMMQRLIDATVQRIRAEQRRGRISKNLDITATAQALVWMEERYLTQTLGRTPRVEPKLAVDVLYRIWVSALYAGNTPRASRKPVMPEVS